MPDDNAPEIPMAGGKVSSSKAPRIDLIPTEPIYRLAKRFEVGVERKKEMAWNALTPNQEVLRDQEFILSRITHVITHALKLRDKIIDGAAIGTDGDDDDAGAIIWGGAFLCCASAAMRVPQLNCSACGGTGLIYANQSAEEINLLGKTLDSKCPACHGTGKSRAK